MSTNKLSLRDEFLHHAARAFFASAWADQCEESEQSDLIGMGTEIMDVMPDDIDPAAIHAARTLLMDVESLNGLTVESLMHYITEHEPAGDRPRTMEFFGHYAAMQAMGSGVGLYDAFGSDVHENVKIGYVEFGSHSLERDYFTTTGE